MNRPLSPLDDITGSTPYVGMAREMASPKYKPIDPLQLHNEYRKISTLAICVDDGEFLCHTAISALGIPSNFTAGSGIQSMLLLLWSSIKAVHSKVTKSFTLEAPLLPFGVGPAAVICYRCSRLALVKGPILNSPATPLPPP